MDLGMQFWLVRLGCAAVAGSVWVGSSIARSELPPAKLAPGTSIVAAGRATPPVESARTESVRSAQSRAPVPTTGTVTSAGPALTSPIRLPAVNRGSTVPETIRAGTATVSHVPSATARTATPLTPRSEFGYLESDTGDPVDGQSGAFGSMLMALGFVIVLMLGVARVLQRRSPLAIPGVPREAIDVLGRRTVDPRNAIIIVRVGPKILLLGNSGAGLTPLSEITDPIEVASLANICNAAGEQHRTDVTAWVAGLFRRQSDRTEPNSFEHRFGERLMADAQQGETGMVTSVTASARREGHGD